MKRKTGLCFWIAFSWVCERSLANVSVTPLRLDIYAQPGGPPETAWLTVTNTSEEPRDISLTPESFEIARDGSFLFEPRLRQERGSHYTPPSYSGAAFLSVPESPVRLDPGESRRVRILARLPYDALGEYYAMVTANPGPATPVHSPEGHREVRITFEISVFVIIVAGILRSPRFPETSPVLERATPARYDVHVSDLRVIFPKPSEPRQTLKIKGTFVNRGNVHLLADVTAEVRNISERRIVESVPCGRGGQLVFPGTERDVLGEVNVPLSPGSYQVELFVRWGEEGAQVTRKTTFEVIVPIPGAPEAPRRLGILDIQPERLTLTTSPGKVVRGEVVVANRIDDRLAVAVRPVNPGGAPVQIAIAPMRFVMPPGTERTLLSSVVVSKDAPSGIHEFTITLEPTASNGNRFPEAETRTVTLTLRILPPPPSVANRKSQKDRE